MTIKHKISKRRKKISDIEDFIKDFENVEAKNEKVKSVIAEKRDKIKKYEKEILALKKEQETEENRCHHVKNHLLAIVKDENEYSLDEYLSLGEDSLEYTKIHIKLSCVECEEIRIIPVKDIMLSLVKEKTSFSDIKDIIEKTETIVSL